MDNGGLSALPRTFTNSANERGAGEEQQAQAHANASTTIKSPPSQSPVLPTDAHPEDRANTNSSRDTATTTTTTSATQGTIANKSSLPTSSSIPSSSSFPASADSSHSASVELEAIKEALGLPTTHSPRFSWQQDGTGDDSSSSSSSTTTTNSSAASTYLDDSTIGGKGAILKDMASTQGEGGKLGLVTEETSEPESGGEQGDGGEEHASSIAIKGHDEHNNDTAGGAQSLLQRVLDGVRALTGGALMSHGQEPDASIPMQPLSPDEELSGEGDGAALGGRDVEGGAAAVSQADKSKGTNRESAAEGEAYDDGTATFGELKSSVIHVQEPSHGKESDAGLSASLYTAPLQSLQSISLSAPLFVSPSFARALADTQGSNTTDTPTNLQPLEEHWPPVDVSIPSEPALPPAPPPFSAERREAHNEGLIYPQPATAVTAKDATFITDGSTSNNNTGNKTDAGNIDHSISTTTTGTSSSIGTTDYRSKNPTNTVGSTFVAPAAPANATTATITATAMNPRTHLKRAASEASETPLSPHASLPWPIRPVSKFPYQSPSFSRLLNTYASPQPHAGRREDTPITSSLNSPDLAKTGALTGTTAAATYSSAPPSATAAAAPPPSVLPSSTVLPPFSARSDAMIASSARSFDSSASGTTLSSPPFLPLSLSSSSFQSSPPSSFRPPPSSSYFSTPVLSKPTAPEPPTTSSIAALPLPLSSKLQKSPHRRTLPQPPPSGSARKLKEARTHPTSTDNLTTPTPIHFASSTASTASTHPHRPMSPHPHSDSPPRFLGSTPPPPPLSVSPLINHPTSHTTRPEQVVDSHPRLLPFRSRPIQLDFCEAKPAVAHRNPNLAPPTASSYIPAPFAKSTPHPALSAPPPLSSALPTSSSSFPSSLPSSSTSSHPPSLSFSSAAFSTGSLSQHASTSSPSSAVLTPPSPTSSDALTQGAGAPHFLHRPRLDAVSDLQSPDVLRSPGKVDAVPDTATTTTTTTTTNTTTSPSPSSSTLVKGVGAPYNEGIHHSTALGARANPGLDYAGSASAAYAISQVRLRIQAIEERLANLHLSTPLELSVAGAGSAPSPKTDHNATAPAFGTKLEGGGFGMHKEHLIAGAKGKSNSLAHVGDHDHQLNSSKTSAFSLPDTAVESRPGVTGARVPLLRSNFESNPTDITHPTSSGKG